MVVDELLRDAEGRDGVLPDRMLRMAVERGVIGCDEGDAVPDGNIQPASLDLRLGPVAHRLRCSFLPGRSTVEERLGALEMGDPISLRDGGAVLEEGRPYLIPLKESLDLPPEVRARTNPKSSTGRADVFTRVITDRSHTFDDIRAGYRGRLYLEVVPLSFAVRVAEDLTLNQLRLSVGATRLGDEDIRRLHLGGEGLLFDGGTPLGEDALAVANGLFLRLDLKAGRGRSVGWVAKRRAPLLDLRHRGIRTSEYWDPVHADDGRIILEPRNFYLLMSSDAVRIPPEYAAEMTAYDPTSGELRTHYAGFFDPGFGHSPDGPSIGSTAALEVRAHDIPFMIEHRQRVCKLTFEAMLAPPERLYGGIGGSHYQGQTETLGKHFLAPSTGPAHMAASVTNQLAFGELADT